MIWYISQKEGLKVALIYQFAKLIIDSPVCDIPAPESFCFFKVVPVPALVPIYFPGTVTLCDSLSFHKHLREILFVCRDPCKYVNLNLTPKPTLCAFTRPIWKTIKLFWLKWISPGLKLCSHIEKEMLVCTYSGDGRVKWATFEFD